MVKLSDVVAAVVVNSVDVGVVAMFVMLLLLLMLLHPIAWDAIVDAAIETALVVIGAEIDFYLDVIAIVLLLLLCGQLLFKLMLEL